MEPYSYFGIVVAGGIFAFLDAFGIGANDVANSFATSVGSRSLTLGQACMIAVFTELGGAVLLGAETTSTIAKGIIDAKLFADTPELLMISFLSALVGSSLWVVGASTMGWPVSTTHSIVGGIAGAGISAFGLQSLVWDSLSKIIQSWVVSPAVAGALGAAIYLVTKYGVMVHKNSLARGLIAIPFYFMFALSISMFYLILKAPKGIDLTNPKKADKWPLVAGLVAGWTVLVGIICFVFMVPYFRRLLVNEEDMKFKHVFNPWTPEQPKNQHLAKKLALGADHSGMVVDEESPAEDDKGSSWIKSALTKGVTMDVAAAQNDHIRDVHSKAVKYDPKTEYLYSFLQVCTAAFASFAHGSNDVANAAGPLSGILSIYQSGKVPSSKVDVPFYVLAGMGIALDLGLVLYGYNVMKTLGNNITYHSPSRGFSMELGAALTVITASFLGLPVSTTHCITGATVAVGLCNGEAKAINWTVVSWALFSWVATLPIAGGISAIVFQVLKGVVSN